MYYYSSIDSWIRPREELENKELDSRENYKKLPRVAKRGHISKFLCTYLKEHCRD